MESGFVIPNNGPVKIHPTNALEQWDGHLVPGVLNAIKATDGAVGLAKANGIGCVALANTNHWIRGEAAENNLFVGWKYHCQYACLGRCGCKAWE